MNAALAAASSPSNAATRWPTALCLAAAAGALAGALATSPHASAAAAAWSGPQLAMLLRFMAGIKAALALALVAAAALRLRGPAPAPIAAAYVLAAALMPAGALTIWHLAHVLAGAALFHGGLLLLLVTGWRDPHGGATLMAAITGRHIPE